MTMRYERVAVRRVWIALGLGALALALLLGGVSCGARTELLVCDSCDDQNKPFACVCPEPDADVPDADVEDPCTKVSADCVGRIASIPDTAPSLLIVLDKSTSMSDDNLGQPIWDVTRQAVGSVMETYKHALRFGLELFPSLFVEPLPPDPRNPGPQSCQVSADIDIPIGAGRSKAQEIVEKLAGIDPAGSTPTAVALQNAFDYFSVGDGSRLQGERFVLLVTDGGPNCNSALPCSADRCTVNIDLDCGPGNCCATNNEACLDDQRVVSAIEALRGIGVDTFVMGLGSSEIYAPILNRLAVAGGRPLSGEVRYYRVTQSEGVEVLTDSLATILSEVIDPCRFEVPGAQPGEVNLFANCMPIVHGNHWTLGEGNPPVVVVEGELCEELSLGTATFDVVIGCETLRE